MDTCEPVVRTDSVDWREQMRFESIQTVINPERRDESESEEDPEEDAVEVDSTLINSSQALMMLDQLHDFFEVYEDEDDCSNVRYLTRKVEQMRLTSKKTNDNSTLFCM